MTDFEIVRLCSEAMGYVVPMTRNLGDELIVSCNGGFVPYDPLHNDAQAMALVKKFYLELYAEEQHNNEWRCAARLGPGSWHKDLNRAICECVAKMQSEASE